VLLPVFAGQPIRFEPEAKPRFEPISLEGWNKTFSTGMPSDFSGAFPQNIEK
jgi:N-acyl-D-glutamate deacylase